MRDFFGEETIRGRRVNVLAGLELHKQLLSREEEHNMIEHVRSWVAAVSTSHSQLIPCWHVPF